MPLDNVVFWVFAPIAIAAAIGMLVTRSVVYAALFLVVNFGCIAVMYLVLDAAFLFAVQIIVYAGAIMVLFLFVIMLLGVDRIEVRSERLWLQRPIAIVLAIGFVLEVAAAVRVLVSGNALRMFRSAELQLNAVNLTLVSFARLQNDLGGQVLAFFSMVVAAAEVVVGLAIIVSIYRRRRTIDVDAAREMRW